MSDYKSYILAEKDIGIWDDFIARSSNGTIFHRFVWLKAAAEHSKMKFIPVAVNKGNNIVCLFPLFFGKKYGLRILLSPPSRCGISHLGPVLNIPASNRYNYEWTFIHIIDEIIHFAERNVGFDYFRILHVPGIPDMRPYIWKGYSVQPKYTYRFDLSEGEERLYYRFHSVTKNMIKKAMADKDILISGDRKYLRSVLSSTEQRFSDLHIKFKISIEYFEKLLGSYISQNFESTAILYKGQLVAGNITVTDKYSAYAWIGFVDREKNIPGVWELIFWENIKGYIQRGFTTYELVDANIRRLFRHKSRYGANLVNYYDVSKT